MFYDAMKECKLNFSDLNNKYIYSFVLQHPDNRIVVEFLKPNIVLVEVYKSHGDLVEQLDIHSDEFEYLRDKITFPKILYQFTSWDNLYNSITKNDLHYTILGCMIKCKKTGERSKIRNPNYELVRRLKGNNPKLQYQYYYLRKLRNINNYLNYFPEAKTYFDYLRNDLHDWTAKLYFNYKNCYILKKERDLKKYPFQFRIHMYNLHKKYIEELRPIRSFISKQTVIHYVNNLEPAALMHSINYHFRKKSKIIDIS